MSTQFQPKAKDRVRFQKDGQWFRAEVKTVAGAVSRVALWPTRDIVTVPTADLRNDVFSHMFPMKG